MKRILFVLIVFAAGANGYAQQTTAPIADTNAVVQLKPVQVKAKWLNDTDRYHYNQMKYYVTTILPYVNAASRLFLEINAKTEDPELSRRERKQYINSKEDEVRTQFEDKVKGLNVTQGALLIKLIARQTNVNIYKMLQEFKNPITALKWQAWAQMNGMNLNRKYDPEEEKDLESIMEELGYPLPICYFRTTAN